LITTEAVALPNYRRIAEELRTQICANVLRPGHRLPSHQSLSRRFAVSRVTIRQALMLLQQRGYVQMIPKTGTFVSEMITSLRRTRHRLVALLVENCQDPFFNEMTQHIERELLRANLHMVLCDTAGAGPEVSYVDVLKDRVDGFIIAPSLQESSWTQYRALASTRLPYVLFDRDIRTIPGNRVLVDNYFGGRIAADHLADLGHSSFVTVTYRWPDRAHETPSEALRLRICGFKDRLIERGIPESDVMSLVGGGGRTKDAGAEAAMQWVNLRPRPTGLFATNDILCLGVIEVAEKSGLRMPRDFSIVGFDDINLVRWLNIPLTTVAQPKEEIARHVVGLLLTQNAEARGDHTQHELLKPRLVIRSSTGCAPKTAE
jgi:DNA-binding LacI/PurR family transcriptional regulator